MARTKASVGAKAAAGKSSKARCSVAPTPSSSGTSGGSGSTSKTHSGGNPVCPRETPRWQRPITTFFINNDERKKDDKADLDANGNEEVDVDLNGNEEAGTSKQKKKKSKVIIQSDSDEEILTEKPKNSVLDESIILEPLNGEDSHKIEEYYAKGAKGKGVGKKTKGKENKRAREEEEPENSSKRVKVN